MQSAQHAGEDRPRGGARDLDEPRSPRILGRHGRNSMVAPRRYQGWSLAAAAWCVAFGVLSLYWAVGGTLGVDQLAVSLQERADERETGFVAIVAATGIAKLLGAIVPLWLVFRPHSRTVGKVLLFSAGQAGRYWPYTGSPISSSLRSAPLRARWKTRSGTRCCGVQPGCLAESCS
jgi:hypothetical protein